MIRRAEDLETRDVQGSPAAPAAAVPGVEATGGGAAPVALSERPDAPPDEPAGLEPALPPVTLTVDGREVTVAAGSTVWEAVRALGIEVPVLCHDPAMRPVGVCRTCVVEVEGARVFPASCVRPAEPGMVVRTSTPRLERQRRVLVELLMADHPTPCEKEARGAGCELERLARRYGIGDGAGPVRLEARPPRERDLSSPVIAVDHAACILCDRCIRACDEVQSNMVIGRSGKGHLARISFDDLRPMGESTCVSCGECMSACPTGALVDRFLVEPFTPAEVASVDSVCPYCGVGCGVRLEVKEDRIVRVEGRDEAHNAGRLCVKGRYGYDYASHPQRLTAPLIRREGWYPKGALSRAVRGPGGNGTRRGRKPGGVVDYDEVMPAFREASWDEALDLAARRLTEIRDTHGARSLAGFGSAKCSNEEAYLFQKLVRTVFRNNNVDHCTRLCHAGSVAAMLEQVGSGSVSDVVRNVEHADLALVIGSNTTENHPVAATFIKDAAKRGTRLVVIDTCRHALCDHADLFLQLRPASDVALFNAMLHVIFRDGLQDDAYIAERTENVEELRETVAAYTPELAERISGIPAATIEEVARAYARGPNSIVFWGMGVSQSVHGTDKARCLMNLVLATGQVGRPGTGFHPLRGQNNVQGASDMGLVPMVYSGYQPVTDAAARARFEAAWGTELDPEPGLTVVEIMAEALTGGIRGMYMMGENPFMSDPNQNKVRKALAALEFLVVQDIFLTETAEFADVVLPASTAFEKTGTYTNTDRRVQVGREAAPPPEQARADWRITVEIANRMGAAWSYASPEEVFAEMATLTPDYAGITYEKLGRTGVVWPCPTPEHPGTDVLFGDGFPRGRGRFSPARFADPAELPGPEFPLVLITGRTLEHWHTGTMTRRASALAALQPDPFVEMHPADMAELGVEEGRVVRVSSARGAIELPAVALDQVARGTVFIPFHYREAAANVLTSEELDPDAKIPDYKFSAVRVEPIADRT
ncbi:MAG: formate dehydrogenase subunit alpha [Gemmatimonadota bacterium]